MVSEGLGVAMRHLEIVLLGAHLAISGCVIATPEAHSLFGDVEAGDSNGDAKSAGDGVWGIVPYTVGGP